MINVNELIHAPEFCQTFTYSRGTSGYWRAGKFIQSDYAQSCVGVVTSVKDTELHLIPEAAFITEARGFYTDTKLELTRATSSEGAALSDIVVYHGNCYKLIAELDYSDYGYYRYIGIRTGAENNA